MALLRTQKGSEGSPLITGVSAMSMTGGRGCVLCQKEEGGREEASG